MDLLSTTNTIQKSPAPGMDPQGPDDILMQHIVSRIEKKLRQHQQQQTPHDPARTYTVCPFPEFLVGGIDDRIQSPQLASFGPFHRGEDRLLPFEDHKYDFLSRFLSRTENLGRDSVFYVRKLMELKESTKRCYSEKIVLPSDDELVNMMLLDGCFMVQLFREYEEEGKDHVTWPWTGHIQILISDILKLENQLPFFILEKLFDFSNIGQGATTRTLPTLALRFLNQAFCRTSDAAVNSHTRHPKHLLDLFRSSLLPSTETYPKQKSKHHPFSQSIQSVNHLRSSGIIFSQKVAAKTLLEIDFRKFQIPPLALKIPPVAVDDFTCTVLMNCVALEQCLPDQTKHFTAYVCFMNCLMKQPEDVGFLRSVDIITRVSQDEMGFINMLNNVGRNASYSVRDSYLWKQFWEIHDYYNSFWASIRRNFFHFNSIMLYCSVLQIAVGILSWRLSGK